MSRTLALLILALLAMTLIDFLNIPRLADPQLSPDGKQIVVQSPATVPAKPSRGFTPIEGVSPRVSQRGLPPSEDSSPLPAQLVRGEG